MGCIYMVTNTVNGKKYIGQTSRDVERRKKEHLRGDGNQPLADAFKKYGEEKFTFEILHDGIIPEMLDNFEIQAIVEYNTLAPNGYNLQYGGGGKWSDESRRKMIGKNNPMYGRTGEDHPNYGKKHTEEACKKMSVACEGRYKGENNPMYGKSGKDSPRYGKKNSEEHRQKISLATKGKEKTEEHRKKISLSLKGRYTGENHPNYGKTGKDSSMYGKRHSEESRKKISLSLKGKYAGENSPNYGKEPSEEHRKKISLAMRSPNHSPAREIFFSLPETMSLREKRKFLYEKFSNMDPSTIRRWIRKWLKSQPQ